MGSNPNRRGVFAICAGAQKTIGALNAFFGRAFDGARRGLGSHPEGAPAHATGEGFIGGRFNARHNEGFPGLEHRTAPLMGVTNPTERNCGDLLGESEGQKGRIAIGSEADLIAFEDFQGWNGGVAASSPLFPDRQWSLPDVYVACSVFAAVAAQWTRTADFAIIAGADSFQWVFGFDEKPDLRHGASFLVSGFEGDYGHSRVRFK